MARSTRKTLKISPDTKLTPVPGYASLVVMQGAPADVGVAKLIDGLCVIGRGLDVDLPLLDEGLSRRHCAIRIVDGGAVVEDLGSTNGTRLNGKKIVGPTRLTHGDVLYISETVLKYSSGALEVRYHASMDERVGIDELTGLIARHRFDGALVRALDTCVQAHAPLGVMMLDLDGIKPINDTHGHVYGAFAIAEAGKMIGRRVADAGTATRLGGDEFAVFLPRVGKIETALMGQAITSDMREHRFEKDGIVLRASVSIGVAASPEDGTTAELLLARADAALYRAKQAGRDRVAT